MTDFQTLLATGSSDARSLQQLEAYYRGAQPLNFLHPDLDNEARQRLWSLVINWPRVVLDAIEERLDVEGFRLGSEKLDGQAWDIWQDNDLDVWSQQCHLDAMLYGRSFAMVWPSKDDPSKPCITIESAAQFAVEYDPTTRRIIKAAKQWKEGDERFVTLYTPTRIERWYAQSGSDSEAEWRLRTDPVPNLYGIVPVVPFVNRPRLNSPMGESELTDVIPLADGINKLATDMMVAAEYHAMPRRWATGMDLGVGPEQQKLTREQLRELWSKAAGDRVWTNSSPDGSFGQFTEASLQNFIAAIRAFALNIAAISGLPPHYLGVQPDAPPSADAIRAAESSLVQKVRRKQRVFGGSWEQVMRLALRIANEGQPVEAAQRMETIWRDPATPTPAQSGDRAAKLVTASVIDAEQAQEDLGYTPTQVQRMKERADERAKNAPPPPVKAVAKPVIDPTLAAEAMAAEMPDSAPTEVPEAAA